jgi:hypothetical protein
MAILVVALMPQWGGLWMSRQVSNRLLISWRYAGAENRCKISEALSSGARRRKSYGRPRT